MTHDKSIVHQEKNDMESVLKEEGKIQRYVSILCRYPRFCLEDDDQDEDRTVEHKTRRINPSIKIKNRLILVVAWEQKTLKKTGGYTIHKNNVYIPKPSKEPQILSHTVISNAEVQQTLEIAQNIPNPTSTRYKYVPTLVEMTEILGAFVLIIPPPIDLNSTKRSKSSRPLFLKP